MKLINRILLILSITLSIIYLAPALNVFSSITTDPQGWQAGVDTNSTLIWFIVITLGYGFLIFQTFLAILGLFWGFKKRKAAFWLLLLPGFIGMVFGLIWLGLFMAFDAEWPASWPLIAVLIITPTVAYIVGMIIRKNLLPKLQKTNQLK
jgi:hypothetical protein